ncbi:MAG TPA: HAD family hydrolase, partial [Longimicrobiales bacterium]|nr:HAD family hydrolase [Longimicrobiales bacterium]
MPRRFDAVVLDAGNTLVFVDPVRTGEILRCHGAPGDPERFTRAEREARTLLSRTVEEGIAGTEDHFWQVYFATLYRGMGLPEAAWPAATEDLMTLHAREHLWSHVAPGTGEALQRILDAGHRLAVVSNADGRVEGLLRDVGLADY